jgi:hypothetical protein
VASNSIKWPYIVATHMRKFATITNLKDKVLAGALAFSKSSTAAQLFAHNGTSVTPVYGYSGPSVSINAAPANALTLTPQQSGQQCLFDTAAGAGGVYTLPAPQVGLWYQFFVTVAWGSNTYKVVTNNPGTVLLNGSVWETVAAGTGTQFFPNGTTHSAISLAGTTTGGLVNTCFDVYCVSATSWYIDGTNMASGVIVSPFTNS